MAGANPSTAAGLERLHKAHVQRYAHICAHHEIQFHPLAFDTLGRAHKSSLPSWSGGRRQRTARKTVSNASRSSAARTWHRLFVAYTSIRGAFALVQGPTGRAAKVVALAKSQQRKLRMHLSTPICADVRQKVAETKLERCARAHDSSRSSGEFHRRSHRREREQCLRGGSGDRARNDVVPSFCKCHHLLPQPNHLCCHAERLRKVPVRRVRLHALLRRHMVGQTRQESPPANSADGSGAVDGVHEVTMFQIDLIDS